MVRSVGRTRPASEPQTFTQRSRRGDKTHIIRTRRRYAPSALLNALPEAKVLVERRRRHYNVVRPHSSGPNGKAERQGTLISRIQRRAYSIF